MQNKKWYVVCQHAEEYAYGIVALTDDELAGAKKMLDYDSVAGGGYCGGFYIEDTAYDTEEQARNAALSMIC